jgi:hypothetical protein
VIEAGGGWRWKVKGRVAEKYKVVLYSSLVGLNREDVIVYVHVE